MWHISVINFIIYAVFGYLIGPAPGVWVNLLILCVFAASLALTHSAATIPAMVAGYVIGLLLRKLVNLLTTSRSKDTNDANDGGGKDEKDGGDGKNEKDGGDEERKPHELNNESFGMLYQQLIHLPHMQNLMKWSTS
jgi:hypothetical protein